MHDIVQLQGWQICLLLILAFGVGMIVCWAQRELDMRDKK